MVWLGHTRTLGWAWPRHGNVGRGRGRRPELLEEGGQVAGRRWKEPVRGLDGGSGGMATARWSGSEKWAGVAGRGPSPGLGWTFSFKDHGCLWNPSNPAVPQESKGQSTNWREALAAGPGRALAIGSLKPSLTHRPLPLLHSSACICLSHRKWGGIV